MSVLYKALQKAAKDNEQRQAAQPGFDAERLIGSGVIRGAGGSRVNWRLAGLAMTVVFVAAMGVAVYLTSSPAPAPPQMQTVMVPPAHMSVQTAPARGPASASPAVAPSAPTSVAASTPVPAVSSAAPPSGQVAAQSTSVAPPAAGAAAPPERKVAAAASSAAEKPDTLSGAKVLPPAPVPKPNAHEPMPDIDPNSPASMLSPPISVHRTAADLAGVGNAVRVRQVSQGAQNSVAAGYSALIRGDYDVALGFYNAALKEEPTSVLASLGRGAALQKLGRDDEARLAYETALKTDPENREALTNLTGILAERQPGEALAKLLDLAKKYPKFSPIVAQIGMTYAKMDKLDAAADYLRQAVDMTPDAVMYNYDLAVVLDQMHLGAQAVVCYRRVLDLLDTHAAPGLSKTDIERRVAYLTVK